MKPHLLIFVCLHIYLVLGPAFGDEEIFPWDALNSEKQFRSAVETRFPDLQFGFYHWNGDWLIGALEDFDHHRVLLLLPAEGAGSAKISRNGEDIPLPPGDPVTLKIAGALSTVDGTVSTPENAVEQRIGYWITLEATDKLSMDANLTWPCKGEFKATYDPDAKWKISFRWEIAEQDKVLPADAYEISRRSLLKQTLEVLENQDMCLIRLKHGLDVEVTFSKGFQDFELEPVYAALSDKIVVGSGDNAEAKTFREFERLVELYAEAAVISDSVEPRVVVQVDAGTDDQVFRATLSILARQGFRRIGLLVKQTNDEKKEAGKPDTRSKSESEGSDKPKPETDGRSR